jgi:hypothetical protein
MPLYPAAMSDPDRNPNFRRLWTEPIRPLKRKGRAEGGSTYRHPSPKREPQQANNNMHRLCFPSRHPRGWMAEAV